MCCCKQTALSWGLPAVWLIHKFLATLTATGSFCSPFLYCHGVPVIASVCYCPPFCGWVCSRTPCWSLQSSWFFFFFLNSSLLECIALGGGDPKVWATCLGNLFPAGLYPIVLHRGDLWRSRILLSWIYWLWLLNSLIHIFSMILPMLSNFLGNIMEYI